MHIPGMTHARGPADPGDDPWGRQPWWILTIAFILAAIAIAGVIFTGQAPMPFPLLRRRRH